MWVRVLCADPALARQGEWDGAEGVEVLLAHLAATAGLPAQVEVEGHGVSRISPTGRVSPGRLFHEAKAHRP